jgi:RHS repeat-associated protein
VGKRFEYDHAGRLILEKQLIGANPNDSVIISKMSYNELGQLQQKTLGEVQDVNYQYNIRGWLTQINDPDNLGSKMFGMKLLYSDQNSNLGNSRQFNGNVAAMIWNSTTKSEQGYAFSYDALNRLSGSDYKKVTGGVWTESSAFEEKALMYDVNGNISHLERTSETGNVLADFTYSYKGNQLQNISGGKTSYTYDENGNMKKDGLRGFDITYNKLNLPDTISGGSENISYIYSASGEKLAKKMKDGSFQYYAGNFVYRKDQVLDYVLFEEGKVNRQETGSLVYDYFIKDHLGNTRVVFSQGGTNARVTEYYPFGMDFSTSSRDAQYLYNGKELQDDKLNSTALDWYDYGARMYDPQIGRFSTQDAFAEKYFDISPYQYAANNPVLFIDVNGDSIDVSKMSKEELEIYQSIVTYQNENSKLFSSMYSSLETSKNVYSIQFGQTSKRSDGSMVDGHFVPNEAGGGTITYLKGKDIELQSFDEELFHAYQNDNKDNYCKGWDFNMEFEAKVGVTAIIGEMARPLAYIAGMEDFQLKVGLGDYGNGKMQISPENVTSAKFLINYTTSANSYAEFNKSNNIGNSHYKVSTNVSPYSLKTMVIKAYGK